MIIYIKLGKIRGASIELNKNFGLKPVYKKTSYHCESIIDVPYTQIIYTSEKWTPQNTGQNHTKEDVAHDNTSTGKKAKQI